ncbi:winged helix-turn-helix domain-containing protein [Alloacidobacterium dinghuense]|uniref:winged helix-turn-helix domain-containing protein n=1 Tax=Alloacidobacterium dinghuense TaxID=2763107 RepID=UPI002554C1AC|nr:winged helix-turn-helix domain-containing protein [Alloacidobacterium dinghuense]
MGLSWGHSARVSIVVDSANYSFGPFRLVPSEHLLLREEKPIPLAPKAYELLFALVKRHGRLVSREELMHEIWPDSFVEEINLTVNISLLRKTLGEQIDGRQYIATVPKRGYRFDATVCESVQAAEEAAEAIGLPSGKTPDSTTSTQQPDGDQHATIPKSSKSTTWRYVASLVLAAGVVVAGFLLWKHWAASRTEPIKVEAHHAGQPENAQAFDLYTRARALWNKRSIESVQQSLDLFRQAINADPSYAEAYAGLADAYITAGSYGSSFLAPQIAIPKAEEAVHKALVLDDSSSDAHTSLAYIKLTYDWDWPGAEAEFKRALALDPKNVNARHWYSHELMAEGRILESHEQSEQALYIEPMDRILNEHMAWHHLMAREYDRSIPQARKAIEIDPDFVQAHRVLGLDYLYTGRYTEACSEFKKGVDLSHGDPVSQAYLARCYAMSHRSADARQILDSLIKDTQERYISSAEIAAVFAALGDDTNCVTWLQKAVQEKSSAMIYLNIDPVFDRMRANPSFQAIVKQIGLTPEIDEKKKI